MLRGELEHKAALRECALEFGMLGDTRMRICWLLCRHPEFSVGEIAEILGVSVSRVSHALGRLRRHEVVVRRREHRQVFYRLAGAGLGRLVRKEVGTL